MWLTNVGGKTRWPPSAGDTAAAGAEAGVFGVGQQMMGAEEREPDDSAPGKRLAETVGLGNDVKRLAGKHAIRLEFLMLPLPVAAPSNS
ncbi:hypothetical protein IFM61606_09439 [Aspergillus udagawae]|uniref:Uncharacterized protein n=1 Tax=Aspergillus udagawae TaxID=91492 RepID=A0ABQ1BA55_9EURO|nr:hypothetical protein IFM61606_09439 [Aspergillus udagawae]GFF56513.1 hypothetical protein IFM51744_08925 [Aspergillus udagawae]GFF97189.1 hypothetical protein IFM53868_08943 [Aspergillus udagawae]